MKKKHKYLSVFLFFSLFSALWNLGAAERVRTELKTETDSSQKQENLTLKQIDVLIKNTEYDTALLELNKYFDANPEQFDSVQQRISKIMKARDLYTVLARQLLKVIREEPENTEKLGRITERLVAMEHNPADRRLDIIKDTNNLAELAKYSLIQNETAALVKKGAFEEALKRADDGFFIYRLSFDDEYSEKPIYAEVEKNFVNIRTFASQFPAAAERLRRASDAYKAVLASGNSGAIAGAFSEVEASFSAYAGIRNGILLSGASFDSLYGKTGARKEEECNLFLRYARDTVFGWQEDPDCGFEGVLDGFWNVSLEDLKNESVSAMARAVKAFSAENEAFFQGQDTIRAEKLSSVRTVAAYAVRLNDLYSLLLSSDMTNYQKGFQNYKTSVEFASLVAEHTERLSETYRTMQEICESAFADAASSAGKNYVAGEDDLTSENFAEFQNNTAEETSLLASVSASIEDSIRTMNAEKPDGAVWAQQYRNAQKTLSSDMTAIRRTKTAGVDITDSLIDWNSFSAFSGQLNEQAQKFAAQKSSSLWVQIAGLYAGFGEEAAGYSEKELLLQEELVDGKTNGTDDILRRYPSAALTQGEALTKTVTSAKKMLSYSLTSLNGKYSSLYTDERSSIQASSARLDSVLAAIRKNSDAASSFLKFYQKALNEADLRFSQAQKALKSENFENARKRLQEAGDKYVEALSYNDDAFLRSSSDAALRSLGEEIKEKENILVVREVRNLKNAARREYFNGNFQIAEKYLSNAKARWADTNVEEDAEITNLMAIVDTALSMKTGRVLLPSDSLYPEMSQVLSIATQYYKQGISARKKGDIQKSNDLFDRAIEKLEELRLVYPLNQEANLTTLRIQQIREPKEFAVRFEQKINAIKEDYKVKEKQRQAYSDLLDLYEINPDYPGIKKLIYDVEVEVGVRQKAVQKNDIAQSKSLYAEAQKLFSSAGRDEEKLRQALAKVDEAIKLNSGNEDAILLKDEISIRLGGNLSVVMSTEDTEKYNRAIQELQQNNVVMANALVNQLLQKPENKKSARILELQKRIKARM